MRVVLYGATGRVGTRILRELLTRGHDVLAASRERNGFVGQEHVMIALDDLSDVNRTTETIRGADAVISAYGPPPNDTDELVAVTKRLVEAVGRSGVARFLMEAPVP